MKSNEMAQWQATLKHELIHAFVFSSSLYPKFVGASRIYLPEGQNQRCVVTKYITSQKAYRLSEQKNLFASFALKLSREGARKHS